MLTIVASAFQRHDTVHIIVNSFIVQTSPHWRLLIVNDGHDPKMREAVQRYLDRPSIEYHEIDRPEGRPRFGHEARNYGLSLAQSPYVLMTSHDNYYVPTFVEEIEQAAARTNADLILFDMIHNYFQYDTKRFLRQKLQPAAIDMGGFVVKTELAKSVGGITQVENFCGDWEFINALVLANKELRCEWIERCLYVHN